MDKVNIQGIYVGRYDVDALMNGVTELIKVGDVATIAYVNVHVINTATKDKSLTNFLNSVDICYADGKGVVLGAKLLGKQLPPRTTGADWIHDLAHISNENSWRIGWLGSEPGVIEQAADIMREAHPGLQIAYTQNGYFPREGPEHDQIINDINKADLDILLVGMGTPIQEAWVADVRDRLTTTVVWCLGATADFISGKTSRGPAWLHNNHEWVARLITEPGRLWKRYLLGNPTFLGRVLVQRLTDRS